MSYELVDPQGLITDRVFLDVSIDNQPSERLVIGLYGNECPMTVSNFIALCSGTHVSPVTNKPLHYLNSVIYRIVPNVAIQGGDFTNNDGTGGESIYHSSKFNKESFRYKHTGFGVLGMSNIGKGSSRSHFYISLKPLPHFDGDHVVFGTVLFGANTLRKIEGCAEGRGGLKPPSKTIRIVDCGSLPPLEDSLAANPPSEENLDETGREANRIMK